jgi:valyl-tRNA synthetase
MSRQLTRDEKTPVLIYKGPATAYKENVKDVAEKEGYRLVDSRGLKKPFINKMRELESILSDNEGEAVKLMFVEGEDVKLFTPKPKEIKNITKSREQLAVESNRSVADAIGTMSAIAEKIGAVTGDSTLKDENEKLKKQIEALTKKNKKDEG